MGWRCGSLVENLLNKPLHCIAITTRKGSWGGFEKLLNIKKYLFNACITLEKFSFYKMITGKTDAHLYASKKEYRRKQ